MNTAKVVVGRLLEIDSPEGFRDARDVDVLERQIQELAARLRKRVIIFADWRACAVFAPDVAQRVGEMFVRDNAITECSAILHTDSQAMLLLQVTRLIREAGNPERRTFTAPAEAEEFLRAHMTAEEAARLATLLNHAA